MPDTLDAAHDRIRELEHDLRRIREKASWVLMQLEAAEEKSRRAAGDLRDVLSEMA